jgi:hypothetical protein
MARLEVLTLALGALIALAPSPVFWPTGASAAPEGVDEICADYRGTSLFGQCTRAVTHDCQDSALADPQCERWAQTWREQTGAEPPWLLECGGSSSRCVFVTSSTHDGNLGGLAGADAICQGLASSSGSLAARGTYKAWLSSSDVSAGDRLAHSAVPYKLVDGTEVASDWVDLTDGTLTHSISITEGGSPLSGSTERVWTNTQADGALHFTQGGLNCVSWTQESGGGLTGVAGFLSSTGSDWTDGDAQSCDSASVRLYCFQQP